MGEITVMKCESCGKEVTEGSSYCPYCFRQMEKPGASRPTFTDEDFSIHFNRATTLWKDNIGNLTLFTLVFSLVGLIPIVNAAFIAGYIRGLQSLSRGGKPRPADIFSAWDCFGNTFAYCLILFIAMILACIIPFFGPAAQFAVAILGTPGLYYVVDRNKNAVEAVRWSIGSVQRHFFPWLLIVLVGGILGSIGLAALLIGVFVTLPWGTLLIIQQYESVKEEE